MRKAYWYVIGLVVTLVMVGNIYLVYDDPLPNEESVWIPQNFTVLNIMDGKIIPLQKQETMGGRKLTLDGIGISMGDFKELFANASGKIIVDNTDFAFNGNNVNIYYITSQNSEKYFAQDTYQRLGKNADIKTATDRILEIEFTRSLVKSIFTIIVLTIMEIIIFVALIFLIVKFPG